MKVLYVYLSYHCPTPTPLSGYFEGQLEEDQSKHLSYH